MATTYLSRTTVTSGASNTTWTWSGWFKRASLGTGDVLFSAYGDAENYMQARFDQDNLQFRLLVSNAWAARKYTNRKFKDVSAWYHVVIVWDTTNGVADDRMRIYTNGVRETSFGTSLNPGSSLAGDINSAGDIQIGALNGANFYNGSMSYVTFTDGTAYDASYFGQTDSDTGEWTINTSPSVTYGTNGFFILKDGNSVTDQSGEGNNLTVTAGTLTATEDCPDDVFCTFNPLNNKLSNIPTFINGNTTINGSSASWQPTSGTLAAKPNLGKFYWEYSQFVSDQIFVGLMASKADFTISTPYSATGAMTYFYTGRLTVDGTETESYFTAISSTTDVVGVALDMTAGTYGEAQFYLNGSTTGAAVALTSNFADQFVMPFAIVNGTGRYVSINTGNGYFATTIISSEGTNASDIGKFEYDVPTGYTALSTKGLNA